MEASKERWHTAYQREVAAHGSGKEDDNSNMEKSNVYL